MATRSDTIDYLLDQLQQPAHPVGEFSTRRMFGEYCLYLNGKVVGFICDDELFVKITDVTDELAPGCPTGEAYPGSKPYLRVSMDRWESRDWLATLLMETAAKLPEPKRAGGDRVR